MHFTSILLCGLAVFAPVLAQQQPTENLTIVQALTAAAGQNEQFAQLAGILQRANLSDALNDTSKNYTVFAPNPATTQLSSLQSIDNTTLSNIIKYHIVQGAWRNDQLNNSISHVQTLLDNKTLVNLPNGGHQVVGVIKNDTGMFINYGIDAAKVQQADTIFKNGVVHIIDKLLEIPKNATDVLHQAKLTRLESLLDQTNLTQTLNNFTGITLFAPTNDAFSKADLGGLNDTEIANVLKYHLVHPDIYYSNLITNNLTIKTVQGGNVTALLRDSGVVLRDARNKSANVEWPNLLTANGVIHVIDSVLLPPQGMLNTTQPTNTVSNSAAGSLAAGMGWVAFSGLLASLLL
ncbi:uncharacterized protein VTP21DRAFT_7004 [Calcarisporiella thermophila]|uniref:uncharacterized protein n=1 Tax=Calcarisporiella thermophila TaxID=911321 RepID=UPI003742D0C0